MSFILYDRFFSLDERTGVLKTFWRVIGHKYNSVVMLHETYPVQTLNCFNRNIASLYIFCKPTQCDEFEKRQLADIQKQYGNNMRIFKFLKNLTVSTTSVNLSRNWDNIQNIFMMHTRLKSNIDPIEIKEAISHRITYKICFNNERTRTEIVAKIKFNSLIMYPDIDLFVPFDDECELFLNHIFPTNRRQDNSKYTYMTVIANHYMNFVPILESFHGLIQLINSRKISQNVLMVNNREVIKNPRTITDMFLDNAPIVDMYIGRVYENEECIEFNSYENEITFIMLRLYIHKKPQYIIFINRKYQTFPLDKDDHVGNVISCNDEGDMLTKFYNMYTNGLIFKVINMNLHFIISSQRYKSNSYILLTRIIYHNLWSHFSTHCVISEDGKCIRFNRNSIILFDNIDNCDEIITNYRLIDKDVVYLPEIYADSTVDILSSFENHVNNIKPEKACKYTEIKKYLNENRDINKMSMYDLIKKIHRTEEEKNIDYSLILESIIELSNKIRIPITILYSLSIAQIAYRLIFYNSIRNGVFLIMGQKEKTPHFYQCADYNKSVEILKKIVTPQSLKVFTNFFVQQDANSERPYIFQNLVKRFIPIHMTGNLIQNYFTYFCPEQDRLPLLSSMIEDENQLLSYRSAIIWSRQQMFSGHSIVSFDFSLYNSSIMSLFGIDFHNCAIIYGFELKNFFMNIFPTIEHFNENTIKFLQLPYTFIMDNDTLKIHPMTSYEDISKLEDHSTYIVIMRFLITHMLKKYNRNYRPLSSLFYENICDIAKYKTRLVMHKNILNSICGMLSAYNINTTILNIVNALSRKIIMWIVGNIVSSTEESFVEHKYDVGSNAPRNLISIENDSFTYIYDYAEFDYTNMEENYATVENIRYNIIKKLCRELATCTLHSEEDITKIINLKLNFITGNLFQVSTSKFFYIQPENNDTLKIVSNERNNRNLQKALKYLNMDQNLIKVLKRSDNIKLTYLKRTYDFTETRRLLIWYMMQQCRANALLNDQLLILNNLRTLNNFLERDTIERREIKSQYLGLLFSTIRATNITEFFLRIVTNAKLNANFMRYTIPESRIFDDFQLPSEKKTLVINCVQIFFKLYEKYATAKKTAS
ncbi:hypothetical protein [Drosophila suzukii associated hytrosavirus 1]|nr:hypothetical protein [Drosophila suzukii associated hytrosavirus 1]